ncbi:MAG: Bacterial type and secretion system protein [Phycisphaerales bacterium]|nr:Bacterial type and secretion system protein [Phycisphaerales bacterium]MDB5332729.1 Bacterial type and secretion system protein [Phycisphaerales bacterium]MDB5357519.1 Bacterial type and secretion system protein [Phycisphaerales bacterium]
MWRRILTGMLAAACIMLTIELSRDRRRTENLPSANIIRAAGLPNSNAARKALTFRFGELNIHSVTFEQAIANLAERAHANINVRWGALQNAGVSRTTKVRLHLWDVTLAQALTAVLAEAEGGSSKAEYHVESGVIVVGTGTEDVPECVTVIYNVRDVIEIEEATTGCTREEAAEMLAKVIMETVSPDSWRDAGGNIGAIRELSGLLVVTHTVEGHQQILRLLEQLRAADHERPLRPDNRQSVQPYSRSHGNGLFGG